MTVTNAAASSQGGPTDMEVEAEAQVGGRMDDGQHGVQDPVTKEQLVPPPAPAGS